MDKSNDSFTVHVTKIDEVTAKTDDNVNDVIVKRKAIVNDGIVKHKDDVTVKLKDKIDVEMKIKNTNDRVAKTKEHTPDVIVKTMETTSVVTAKEKIKESGQTSRESVENSKPDINNILVKPTEDNHVITEPKTAPPVGNTSTDETTKNDINMKQSNENTDGLQNNMKHESIKTSDVMEKKSFSKKDVILNRTEKATKQTDQQNKPDDVSDRTNDVSIKQIDRLNDDILKTNNNINSATMNKIEITNCVHSYPKHQSDESTKQNGGVNNCIVRTKKQKAIDVIVKQINQRNDVNSHQNHQKRDTIGNSTNDVIVKSVIQSNSSNSVIQNNVTTKPKSEDKNIVVISKSDVIGKQTDVSVTEKDKNLPEASGTCPDKQKKTLENNTKLEESALCEHNSIIFEAGFNTDPYSFQLESQPLDLSDVSLKKCVTKAMLYNK